MKNPKNRSVQTKQEARQETAKAKNENLLSLEERREAKKGGEKEEATIN